MLGASLSSVGGTGTFAESRVPASPQGMAGGACVQLIYLCISLSPLLATREQLLDVHSFTNIYTEYNAFKKL